MEAMATGLPAIGTNWSGNTASMTAENSYLLEYTLKPVPERGWREVPTYQGHRWAEPDRDHLVTLLRQVVEDRDRSAAIGRKGRDFVTTHFNRQAVGDLMRREIDSMLAVDNPRKCRHEETPHESANR